MTIKLPFANSAAILALGAESAGVFALYRNGSIFISENFGDLLDDNNFLRYKKGVLTYLQKEKIKPDVILTDLHPLFRATIFGTELAKKYRIPHIKVQHHIAHIFSAVADKIILDTKYLIPNTFYGIAMDGTGYGFDENVWGGEIFKIQNSNLKNQNDNSKCKISKNKNLEILRIGSLEEQVMIGGDAAVRGPARMVIAILARITNQESRIKNKKTRIIESKKDIYKFVKKFYTRNEFEALYNQMEQNFNCQTTTSTGRVLDAVSVLLGFAGNERRYKHEAVKLLEENSTEPYEDLELRIMKYESRKILNTTHLFEYLVKNIKKDKRRLAATAQLYIAKGLCELIEPYAISHSPFAIFTAAGGMVNNKIISSYLEKQGVYLAKKIPRGDEGIAIGQIVYYLTNPWY